MHQSLRSQTFSTLCKTTFSAPASKYVSLFGSLVFWCNFSHFCRRRVRGLQKFRDLSGGELDCQQLWLEEQFTVEDARVVWGLAGFGGFRGAWGRGFGRVRVAEIQPWQMWSAGVPLPRKRCMISFQIKIQGSEGERRYPVILISILFWGSRVSGVNMCFPWSFDSGPEFVLS